MVQQDGKVAAEYETQSRPLPVVRGPLWVHCVHQLEHGGYAWSFRLNPMLHAAVYATDY